MKRLANFINGQFQAPAGGAYLPVFDPSKGKPYTEAPDSDEQDVALAVSAAKAAQEKWANTSIDERYRVLNNIALGIEKTADELAAACCTVPGRDCE